LLRRISFFVVFLWCLASAVDIPLSTSTDSTARHSTWHVASAAESDGSAAARSQPAVPATSGKRVELLPDQKAGALRVVIDGTPVAWFDADGLHVRQNIEYGGTISDIGTEHLEKQARGAGAR
jgi:hypothetical protein